MKIRIIDKTEDPESDRRGEVYSLYLDLVALMENTPEKKAIVTFSSKSTGLRLRNQLLQWADEDGYTLYAAAIRGTSDRILYLEPE